MLALYALGKLDLYRDVFDVDRFYQHIDEYLGYMLRMRRHEVHHSFHDEVYRCLAERDIPIPFSAKNHARRLELNTFFSYWKEAVNRIVQSFHLS
jgi:hypothetical protein